MYWDTEIETGAFMTNNEEKMNKPTCEQLIEQLGDNLDITICSDVVYGLGYEYQQLENEVDKLNNIIKDIENAIDEIISEYDSMINLNNQLVEECQRLDDEETRLNNIIDELEKYCWELKAMGCREGALDMLDKIKELKEKNND